MRGVIIAAIVASSALSAPASGQAPKPLPLARSIEPADSVLTVTPSRDGTTLNLRGWLDVGSFIKFRRIVAAHRRARTVTLASAGGLVQEGALIGSVIRDAGLATRVETICASACTLAFAAGSTRQASEAAWLGFHRARWVAGPDGRAAARGAAADTDMLQRAAFKRAGLTPSFIASAMAVPADTIWFPDRPTLVAARVIDEAGAGPGVDVSDERTAAAKDLRRLTLWQAAEAHAPHAFAQAVEIVWHLRAADLPDAAIYGEAQASLIRAEFGRIAGAPEPIATALLTALATADPAQCDNAGWGSRIALADAQAAMASLAEQALRASTSQEMGWKEARKLLRKPQSRVMELYPALRRSSDPALRCRASLALLREIDLLRDDQRWRGLRAFALLQGQGELSGIGLPL